MHRAVIAVVGLVVLTQGCAPDSETGPGMTATAVDRAALVPVSLPDLSRLEESVQAQVRAQHDGLTQALVDPAFPAADLAERFGALGTSLMAAENFDAAEPYYLNAQALAPGDRRWPYYLGHLHRATGQFARSVTAFERALELQPDDVAALVWLGEVQLADGQPETAERRFAHALSLRASSLAALSGLGRAALANEDFSAAVEHLERALALEPGAASLHYPLGLAYRGLGEAEMAERHLAQRGEFDIRPVDALMDALRASLQSAINLEIEGSRALDEGNIQTAIEHFRRGLELAPDSSSLRYRLATALVVLGDGPGALTQFEQVVRVSPDHTEAHFGLGMLLDVSGRGQEAIERFATVVRLRPDHLQARFRLAALLRRNGRPEESLAHFAYILEVDPAVPEAAAGYAMAMVSLQRYREARDLLSDALEVYPDQPEFAHALARVLAAAPDPRVRDGERALAILQALPEAQRRLDLGETMAMTLAELGRFDEAVTWQRNAMEGARQAGRPDLADRMAENLERYLARQPCRTPWRAEDLP